MEESPYEEVEESIDQEDEMEESPYEEVEESIDEDETEKSIDEEDKEKLQKKYETYLCAMNLMRENWNCDKIGLGFDENVQTECQEDKNTKETSKKEGLSEVERECQKYRKYLGILYAYVLRVYAGVSAVKPMFYFGNTFAFCTLTETVESLVMVSKFFSNSEFAKSKKNKLETVFARYYEPKLYNEHKLDYEANWDKETLQEIIAQMGHELKWDNGINEAYVKLIQPKFDETLQAMAQNSGIMAELQKKMEASAKNTATVLDILSSQLHRPISHEMHSEYALVAFVKGHSIFKQFCIAMEKEDRLYVGTLLTSNNPWEMHMEHLTEKNEMYLGLLHLMRQNWNNNCKIFVNKRERNAISLANIWTSFMNIYSKSMQKLKTPRWLKNTLQFDHCLKV